MKAEFKFSNGDEVRDLLTGITGIIDCCSIWINGCVRYSVQPPIKKGENEKPDSYWMDEEQLEKISDGLNKIIKPTKTGGPTTKSSGARM